MNNLPLQDLTDRLEKELYRLHYNKQSVKYYRGMWKRIARFFANEGVDHFEEDIGMRFLEKEYNFFELEKSGQLTQSIINVFRVIRMLGDFQQHGSILRRYYKQKELLQNNEFKDILQRYASHCQNKEYSKVTNAHYRKINEQFLSFLESHEIRYVADLSTQHLADYINTLLGYSYKTVELNLCALRSFLRFLHTNSLHSQDLSVTVPSVKARNKIKFFRWTTEHVTKLLEAIDRGICGKRDYAMLLMVTRLGLRTADIKHLKMDNLKWQDNRISLIQSKTSREINLPLLPDVGWAIIDYLKHGPKSSITFVFLRHLAPLEPFQMKTICIKCCQVHEISQNPISPLKKKGMHSLRHTLASRLLENKTPLSVISDILDISVRTQQPSISQWT